MILVVKHGFCTTDNEPDAPCVVPFDTRDNAKEWILRDVQEEKNEWLEDNEEGAENMEFEEFYPVYYDSPDNFEYQYQLNIPVSLEGDGVYVKTWNIVEI